MIFLEKNLEETIPTTIVLKPDSSIDISKVSRLRELCSKILGVFTRSSRPHPIPSYLTTPSSKFQDRHLNGPDEFNRDFNAKLRIPLSEAEKEQGFEQEAKRIAARPLHIPSPNQIYQRIKAVDPHSGWSRIRNLKSPQLVD